MASFEHFKRAQKTNAQSAAGEEEERTNERRGSFVNTRAVLFRTSYFSSSHSGFIHRAVLWSFIFSFLVQLRGIHYFWINLSKRRRGIHKQSSRVKFERDLTLNARDRALDTQHFIVSVRLLVILSERDAQIVIVIL